ncbi:MAG: hypothetical protein AWU57_489 [Marinobacter sp. T13-3]|nr:MAG: hypothetical protein AWU57_489 [Marinobacter sp. T13-3]
MTTPPRFLSTRFARMDENALFLSYLSVAKREMAGVEEISSLTGTFATEAEAERYVKEQTKYQRLALAVKVHPLTDLTRRRIAKQEQRLAGLQAKRDRLPGERLNPLTFEQQVLAHARQKHTFKLCAHCQSRINTRYLASLDCPACGEPDFIVTKGQHALRERQEHQREKWEAQLAEVERIIDHAIATNSPESDDWYWYVGTWHPEDNWPEDKHHDHP